MNLHNLYMHRCLQLARLGAGNVAPNPMVGSVLVYNNRIIGEGYHQQYGQPHAEVNCINSVVPVDKPFIPLSTLYVSLEPCAHFGKTPPCCDLIIALGITKVVVGCSDPFVAVNGKGIEKMQRAGIEVLTGLMEEECIELNKRFLTFHRLKRPYIILKWAQTLNGIIGSATERLHISNAYTQRLVHHWRSINMAILIGTKTALADDPQLDVRYTAGPSPIRLVLDLHNKLPKHLRLFNQLKPTIIFSYSIAEKDGNTQWVQLNKVESIIQQVFQFCYTNNIHSILVEGGAITLQSFIDEGVWDEAIIIKNLTMNAGEGIAAPVLKHATLAATENMEHDLILYYKPATPKN